MKTAIKNYVLALMMIITCVNVKAQFLSAGIVGGVTTGTVTIKNINMRFADQLESRSMYGLRLGFMEN
jgi:hypothetical protein